MRRPALLLALLTIVAGCTSAPADVESATVTPDPGVTVVARPPAAGPAEGSAAPPEPSAETPASTPIPILPRLPFGAPVELPLVGDVGGGEPNIAALPDGTLFVAAPSGAAPPNALRGGGYLWRSTDGGATWETLRAPEGPGRGLFCSCDSDVVTSPDGWTYYSDWWLTGFIVGAGNYLVERSPDGGETWQATPITTRDALLNNVDRQWLVAGDDGFVGLFYSFFTILINDPSTTDTQRGIHAVFSRDHGETWSDPVVVLPGGSWQIAHPRILPDGTLVAPYGLVDFQDGFWRDPSTVMVAVSSDGGASWEQRKVVDVPEGFDNLWAVQADVDASGALHVAWSARVDDDTMATYIATSRDAGATWTDPLALRAEGLNFLPWVATFGDDTVAVGWYGGDATGDADDAPESALWYAYVAQSIDGGETFAIQRVSEEPVKKGPLCAKGASCDGDRELLDYVSLVYDADGNLHYAYAVSRSDTAHTVVATAPGAAA